MHQVALPRCRDESVASSSKPRVLIMADSASERFGGEAILPLQYFRRLRSRGVEAWLITHSRVRNELAETHEDLLRYTYFVEDSYCHRLLWRVGTLLSHRLRSCTTDFLSRLLTQGVQRRLARRLIFEHKIDVIHQPTPVSPREPSLIFGLQAPVIIGPMNCSTDFPPSFSHEHRLSRILFNAARRSAPILSHVIPGKRRAAALLVANSRTRRALREVSSAPIYDMPENGVDLNLWMPRVDRKRAPNDCRFVYVGSLIKSKGIHLWLEAIHTLIQEGNKVSGLVIGDGPERAKLEEHARKLGILGQRSNEAGKVYFGGWIHQHEVARVLASQDALVFPTLCECGGAVVLEAMSTQLPVIATDWGGPRDYLDEYCGILVKPDSIEAFVAGLSNAMRRLAMDPELCAQMGRAGRLKVERHYSWDAKLEDVIDHYHQAIGQRWGESREKPAMPRSQKAF